MYQNIALFCKLGLHWRTFSFKNPTAIKLKWRLFSVTWQHLTIYLCATAAVDWLTNQLILISFQTRNLWHQHPDACVCFFPHFWISINLDAWKVNRTGTLAAMKHVNRMFDLVHYITSGGNCITVNNLLSIGFCPGPKFDQGQTRTPTCRRNVHYCFDFIDRFIDRCLAEPFRGLIVPAVILFD